LEGGGFQCRTAALSAVRAAGRCSSSPAARTPSCWCTWRRKAFWPAASLPLLHIDTGHNFPETLEFRDRLAAEVGAELLVRYVQDSIDRGRRQEETGSEREPQRAADRDAAGRADGASGGRRRGGARRDEEKARAKERFFSHRDRFGQWDPKNQRPELWNLFNGMKNPGEHFRVFPLSNWTEMDVWQYIRAGGDPAPSLYFAHEREVVEPRRDAAGQDALHSAAAGERVERQVRFRTIGDATCTGAVESEALTWRRSSRRRRGAGDRAGRPERRPALRGRHGRPQATGVLLMTSSVAAPDRWTSSASPPPAAWTTARAR
jgi:sulfate adenylyltransferase subunit 2